MTKPLKIQQTSPASDEQLPVQALVRLSNERRYIQVGTAAPHTDPGGRRLLCIRLEALPTDHRLYLPLQDVLALCATENAGLDLADHALPPHPRHGHA